MTMVKRDIFDIPSISSQPVTILPPSTINTKCINICTRNWETNVFSFIVSKSCYLIRFWLLLLGSTINMKNNYEKYTKIVLCNDWATILHKKGFIFISWFIKINTAVILVEVGSHFHYFINFGHTVHVCVSWEETSSHCDSKWIKTLALYGGYKAWYELSSMKRTNFTLYFRSNLDMPLLR